jgi:vacuolar iron transporter family protein
MNELLILGVLVGELRVCDALRLALAGFAVARAPSFSRRWLVLDDNTRLQRVLTAVMTMRQREQHRTTRIGWLRATVLGANDGIVSTASLVIGVAAANAGWTEVFKAGVAGLAAGALSMAAGEYVSVSSQADTERADLALEKRELARDPEGEVDELAAIYARRGLDPSLAITVARQLMAHDPLTAHARDELGIVGEMAARPLQAALASAAAFAVGAALPILTVIFAPRTHLSSFVAVSSLVSLIALGALAARTGGASPVTGAARVAFWGALAMTVTAVVGWVFGAVV